MTRLQKSLLDFISSSVGRNGYSPSYEEMQVHLGLKSKASIHRLVVALEKQGRICRNPGNARSVEPATRHAIEVDAATYRHASAKATAAGMSLSQYTAVALNVMETRR